MRRRDWGIEVAASQDHTCYRLSSSGLPKFTRYRSANKRFSNAQVTGSYCLDQA